MPDGVPREVLITADAHVGEMDDLIRRVPEEFRDRIPRMSLRPRRARGPGNNSAEGTTTAARQAAQQEIRQAFGSKVQTPSSAEKLHALT